MSTDKNNKSYIEKEFEENRVIYKSTELPFEDNFDFSPLVFSLSPRHSTERYTAQSVVKKSNLRMEKGKAPKSSTYPIKPKDLVWFAITEYKEGYPGFNSYSVEQDFGPYIVTGKEDDLKIHLMKNTPKGRTLKDLIKIIGDIDVEKVNSVNVRLFRHVDRHNPLNITYAFEKEPETGLNQVKKPDNFPEKPPFPEDHPNYSDSNSSDPALEPIDKPRDRDTSGSGQYVFEGEDIELHEHIKNDLKDSSITHITKKTNISNWRNWGEMREQDKENKGE